MASFPRRLAFELRDRLAAAREALLALDEPGVLEPANAARDALDALLERLTRLLAAAEQDPEDGERHTAEFRAIALQFRDVEELRLAFLLNLSDSSRRMTTLTAKLAREIGLQRAAAAVSTVPGRPAFMTFTEHGLIAVPPAQRGRLLVLPVLAHELAHLVWARELRDLEDWALATATSHANRRGPPAGYSTVQFGQSWRRWASELTCDIVAAYTCGPAHLRALLMLGAAGGAPPFGVEAGHPAEHVRVTMALGVLERIGCGAEAADLETEWEGVRRLRGYGAAPPEVDLLHPPEIVASLVNMLYDRAPTLDLVPYAARPKDGCVDACAAAYVEHAQCPGSYLVWERDRVAALLA